MRQPSSVAHRRLVRIAAHALSYVEQLIGKRAGLGPIARHESSDKLCKSPFQELLYVPAPLSKDVISRDKGDAFRRRRPFCGMEHHGKADSDLQFSLIPLRRLG